MVFTIANAASKDRAVTTEAIHSGQGLGDYNETARDVDTRSEPGSPTDPHAIEKLVS